MPTQVREKKEANKSRARFWEMAGSKMAEITGLTTEEQKDLQQQQEEKAGQEEEEAGTVSVTHTHTHTHIEAHCVTHRRPLLNRERWEL